MVGRDRRARRRRANSNETIQHRIQSPPIALTIAGSDSSAGAGIQADLKTFTALGVYGLTAVTCIVAEVPRKVSRIEPVTARMVREQIEVLLKNFRSARSRPVCSAQRRSFALSRRRFKMAKKKQRDHPLGSRSGNDCDEWRQPPRTRSC